MSNKLLHPAVVRGRTTVHNQKRYEENKNTVGDVLLDLMHYSAQEEGKSFFEELQWAQNAFAEDVADSLKDNYPYYRKEDSK